MSNESYKTLYLYFVSIVITGDNKLTFTRQTRGNKSREQLSETLSLVTSPQRRPSRGRAGALLSFQSWYRGGDLQRCGCGSLAILLSLSWLTCRKEKFRIWFCTFGVFALVFGQKIATSCYFGAYNSLDNWGATNFCRPYIFGHRRSATAAALQHWTWQLADHRHNLSLFLHFSIYFSRYFFVGEGTRVVGWG